MKRSLLLSAACLVACHVVCDGVGVAAPTGQPTPPKRAAVKPQRPEAKHVQKPKRPPLVTAEQEATALAFAKSHFPELARLVAHLKKRQPQEYDRAVRDLSRTADRMSRLRQQDAGRYELELKAWKSESRIELLTAQWKLDPSDKIRTELRNELMRRGRLRRDVLVRERNKMADRLDKLDGQIEKFDRDHAASIDRLLDRLVPIEKQPADKEQSDRRRPPASRTSGAGKPRNGSAPKPIKPPNNLPQP